MADADALAELVAGTRKFLDLHLEALGAWPAMEPERADAVAKALIEGVDGTLRENVRRFGDARAAASPREDASAFLRELDAVLAGDADARAAWAQAALEKRVDELTGSLFAYAQTLRHARFLPDEPTKTALALDRVRDAHARAARGAALALDALATWAAAASGERRAPATARPQEHVLAAREALAAGVPAAALPLLGRALAAAIAGRVGAADAATPTASRALDAWDAAGARWPMPRADVERVVAALADPRAGGDDVAAWRLLDAVEFLVNAIETTPLDADAATRAARALENL